MSSLPIYALHKAADGKVLGASSFGYSFQLNDWLRSLDVRPGDRVEFEAVTVRDTVEEAPELSVVSA